MKPFDKQVAVLKDGSRNIGVFCGKRCINPHTLVTTKKGQKKFRDLKLGDFILSYSIPKKCFVWSSVLCDAFCKFIGPGIKISHKYGEFEVSTKHKVLKSNHEYTSAQRLKVGTWIKVLGPDGVSRTKVIKRTPIENAEWWDVQVFGTNNYVAGYAIHHNSGKTEIGAIKSIIKQEKKRNNSNQGVDPFTGAIIAPTTDMLRRLSLKKFMAYAKPFIRTFKQTTNEIEWHDGSIIYGLSADKPERIEGLKLNWCWLDEVLQMKEQVYTEVQARVADTQGDIICTGSLGVQFVNPKMHWAYKYYKMNESSGVSVHEWDTQDNPHFPQDEIQRLRETLDPETFRAMFQIRWDTTPKSAVYADFGEANIVQNYVYNPALPTYVSVDWGWTNPMAVGFFQYDKVKDTVYLFDEIVKSNMTLEQLHAQILLKPYKITDWCCDIAGNQEREQTGVSNVIWFRQRGIHFKFRSTAITYGLPIVRRYIKNGKGQTKFYVDARCVKSIDGIKQYKYPEKNGIILNENPEKVDDHVCDEIRYFFVNFLDNLLINDTQKVQIFER